MLDDKFQKTPQAFRLLEGGAFEHLRNCERICSRDAGPIYNRNSIAPYWRLSAGGSSR